MSGDKQAFGKIASTLVQFDGNFEIAPLKKLNERARWDSVLK
jgi:hypothetical protein